MPKRLTDTDKWKDEWYISLCNDYKIIWQWLLDNCSHAGLLKRNMTLLNMMCKTSITEIELFEIMEGRVIHVKNQWFIPKFLKFQYERLDTDRPVVISVVGELEKHDLISLIEKSFGNDYLIIKRKRKDKDKDSLNGGVGEDGQLKTKINGKEPIINFEAQGADLLARRTAAREQELAIRSRKENNQEQA